MPNLQPAPQASQSPPRKPPTIALAAPAGDDEPRRLDQAGEHEPTADEINALLDQAAWLDQWSYAPMHMQMQAQDPNGTLRRRIARLERRIEELERDQVRAEAWIQDISRCPINYANPSAN